MPWYVWESHHPHLGGPSSHRDWWAAEQLLPDHSDQRHAGPSHRSKWEDSWNVIRLKKINHMSQSCRVHLFFGAHLIQQNPRFEFFFACLIFFFSFLWTFLSSKYTRKDMTNTMKHFEQQTSSTLCSVLYLAHPKIKFHISKLWPTQILHVCCSGKKKKKKKKKRSKKPRLGQVFQFVTSFET